MALWLNKYKFSISPIGRRVPEAPSLYILSVRESNDQGWIALYVGKTEDLSSRSSTHQNSSAKNDYSHFHYLIEHDSIRRDQIEEELIQNLQPPRNTQLK